MSEASKPMRRAPAAVGAAALIAALATPVISKWEGERNRPYRDIVGVLTVCRGHTGPGIQNRYYPPTECKALLEQDARTHLAPILACVPKLAERPKVAAASLSLAYNIGTAGFCRSTAAARFRAGDWRGGCQAIGRFIYAGGRPVQGLVNRRRDEVSLCMEGAQ